MAVKVFVASVTPSMEVKKRTQKLFMTLESMGISFEAVDITQEGGEKDREYLRLHARSPAGHSLSVPQIFNQDIYCGDFEDFENAIESKQLFSFLRLDDAQEGHSTPKKAPKPLDEERRGEEGDSQGLRWRLVQLTDVDEAEAQAVEEAVTEPARESEGGGNAYPRRGSGTKEEDEASADGTGIDEPLGGLDQPPSEWEHVAETSSKFDDAARVVAVKVRVEVEEEQEEDEEAEPEPADAEHALGDPRRLVNPEGADEEADELKAGHPEDSEDDAQEEESQWATATRESNRNAGDDDIVKVMEEEEEMDGRGES